MKHFLEKNKKGIFFGSLFFLLFLAHFFFEIHIADDVFFKNIAMNDLPHFLGTRYQVWSSRILIEFVLVTFLHLPDVCWFFCNTLFLFLIGYSLCKLFRVETFSSQAIIYLLIFLYPLYQMSGAGWYATTINYLWPFACGLFSLIPIRNVLDGKKMKPIFYPFTIFSLLFACNQEQMCALLFAFYLLFLGYFLLKKKKCSFLWVLFLITLCSLFFILTCPGNGVRSLQEMNNWYPAYQNFNIIQKGILGLLSTVSFTIFRLQLPFLVLSFLLVFSLRNHESIFVRINSYVPLGILILFRFFPTVTFELFPAFSYFVSRLQEFMTPVSSVPLSFFLLLLLIFSLFLIFSIAISLYFIFREEKGDQKYFFQLVYLAGVASRLILGFSATLYASGDRTFLFYYYGMIFCILAMFFRMPKKNYPLFIILGSFLVLFQIFNTVILA